MSQMYEHPASSDHHPQDGCSPSSSCSSAMTHHQSMSSESFSPIIHSSSSFSTDDNYETSSPVNEADEIILRKYYSPDPAVVGYGDRDSTSLWHDLDRDGVGTPAIPSFILNSPPLGPVRRGGHLARILHKDTRDPEERHVHSCEADIGRDPRFFFGESVGENTLNAQATTYISETQQYVPENPIGTDHVSKTTQYTSNGYHSDSPSSTSANAIEDNIWSNDALGQKYIPTQGPWGIIPSRSVMLSNLPKTTQLWTLVELLKGLGDRTGIFTETIHSHGTAIVSFHDLRDAMRCLRHLRKDNFFPNRRLDTHFVSNVTLHEMASQGYKIPFFGITSGRITISAESGEDLDFHLVKNMLETFGEIYSLDVAEGTRGKVIVCEYFDRRRTTDVVESMHGRDMFGVRLAVWNDPAESLHRDPLSRDLTLENLTFPRSSPFPGYKPLGHYFTLDKRDHWNGKSAFPNLKFVTSDPESSKPHDDTFRRNKSENILHPTPTRGYIDSLGQYDAYPTFPRRPLRKWSEDDLETYFSQLRITPRRDSNDSNGRTSPGLVRPMPVRPTDLLHRFERDTPTTNESESSISGDSLGTSSGNSHVNGSVGVNVPERNKVVLEKIRRGLDARTTIMVKNVPNKYTQQMLMEYVDITNAGTYDFLYLRIDFQNKCKYVPVFDVDTSVGYAFINFIDPLSIIPFAKARVGTKWNRFHSDKICDISYANIQGKECLIEKFRNSCVMDEDPSYRPKIFHSTGPLMGCEQEFPEPNNARRKLRSIACARQIGLFPPVALRKVDV